MKIEYVTYRDALRKLSDANADNAFQLVMESCHRSFLAGKMTVEEFNAICHVASVLNFVFIVFMQNE